MKVYNLACSGQHRFEGWFNSAEDYDRQQHEGMLECPMCGDRDVRRLPSAPRLNLGASEPVLAPSAVGDGVAGEVVANLPREQLQAMWLRIAREIRDGTEDVGERFAEEARKIHYNEAPARGIRGMTSAEEADELQAEGIEFFAFPMPRGSSDPVQ